MKDIDDKTIDMKEMQELGEAVTSALRGTATGECASLEDIAALVEGNLDAGAREALMEHMASCDRCYETFLLTGSLKEKEAPVRKKNFLSSPMRLAASIFVAVFSVFLIYKLVYIPRVSEKAVREMEAPAPAVEALADDEKKEKRLGTVGGEGANEKKSSAPIDREQPPERDAPPARPKKGGPADMKTGAPSVMKKDALTTRGKGTPMPAEKAEKKASKGPGKSGRLEKQAPSKKVAIADVKKREAAVQKAETSRVQVQEEAPPDRQVQAMDRQQQAVQLNREPLKQKTQQQFQYAAQQEAEEDEQVTGGIQAPSPLQDAVLLNRRLSTYRAYIPAPELEKFFGQTLTLVDMLQGRSSKFGDEETRRKADKDQSSHYAQQVEPAIHSAVVAGRSYLYPNIEYFLARSRPGTPQQRFFQLARSGWCLGDRCFGIADPRPLWSKISNGEVAKEGGEPTREELLKAWRELKPLLSGLFQQIAGDTILHLGKEPGKN